ncbi:MAG: V-type ATP synthase subunit I [Spirochaetota bacterium]
MALDPVSKVEITAHNAELDELLAELQSLSVMQIDPHCIREWESEKELIADSDRQAGELRARLTSVKRAVAFLQRFTPKMTILQKLSQVPDFKTRGELEDAARSGETGVVERALELERELDETGSAVRELEQRIVQLEPLRALDLPLSALGAGDAAVSYAARIDRDQFEELAAQAGGRLVHLERVPYEPEGGTRDAYFVLAFHREAGELVEGLEKQFRYEPLALPAEHSTPAQLIERHHREIDRLLARRETLARRAGELARSIAAARYEHDYLETEIEKERSKQRFFYTRQTSVIQGWIKRRDIPLLRQALGKYQATHLQEIEREEEEAPPVAYRNNPLVSPFEIIVNLYSPPNHREIDPTPILMPFYAVFFGICLTDAGYGLVTALISAVAMAMIKTENGVKKFMRLFFILGCFTFVIGALIGTVFGINFDLLPENLAWLREARYRIMLFDSGKDVLTFFGLSLALGVVHIIAGYLIKMYMLFRDGEWAEAVCDHLPWVMILVAPAPLVLRQFVPGIENPMRFFLVMLFTAAGIMLFFSERSTLNPLKRIGKGIFTIYGITGVLGDVLSYSRLLALGLATGVIAGVMNTLAGMVSQIPLVGIAGFVLVLIFGHLFNLFISGLSAFVHSIRLQFMEFFTKFYTGEGELLTAFSEKRTYTCPVKQAAAGVERPRKQAG